MAAWFAAAKTNSLREYYWDKQGKMSKGQRERELGKGQERER